MLGAGAGPVSTLPAGIQPVAPATPAAETAPPPTPFGPRNGLETTLPPASSVPCGQPLQGPILSPGQAPPKMATASVEEGDRALPINLATALRLSDARPLIINAAQASVQLAAAQLSQANVLWLPNLYAGGSYLAHFGGSAGNRGPEFINTRDQYMAGGGLTAFVSTADAIFAPLAQRQVLRSRQIDVQTARNNALLGVAHAYFNVQQARGRLGGFQDAVLKSQALKRTIRDLAKDLTAPIEVDRALTQLADLEREVSQAYEDWRTSSADLTRELRLDPTAVITPLEPPYLQVTLLSPQESVDTLIPIGLTNRPELASQQALVQATLVRIKQERLRPLIPSLVLAGNPVPVAPFGYLMGGVFGSSVNGQNNPTSGRFDPNVQVLWELQNLGFGNRALVRERQAEQQQALVELMRLQDRIAAEIARAHARVQSSAVRVAKSEVEVKEALITFQGNLKGITETIRFGDRLIIVNRPSEAVDSLRQVQRAYDHYFASVGDYNRAQFQLFWSLGYPAGVLACQRSPEEIVPVDTTRPAPLPPVNAPEPCQHCPP